MAVKRMATLPFLGAVTMLLLGALVYLAATGGRPERQPVPRSEGVELLQAGAGAPGETKSRRWPQRVTSASCPERSGLQKSRSNLALWY